jgi:Outer membrane lipoprotein-sorting protein
MVGSIPMAALPRTSAVLLAAAVALLSPARSGASIAFDQHLAEALQKKYDGIKDFSADFVHVYQGGVLRKRVTERGHVLIKKPGKMRWEYQSPEPKLFVSDGVKIYSYIPQDKQVIVSTVPGDDEAPTPVLFLSGKGNILRDFIASAPDARLMHDLPAGSVGLKLVPKSHQADYDWLVVAAEPASLAIVGLVTTDAQGGQSSFSFTNLKENVGLVDKSFEFKIPRGVDVVTDTARR